MRGGTGGTALTPMWGATGKLRGNNIRKYSVYSSVSIHQPDNTLPPRGCSGKWARLYNVLPVDVLLRRLKERGNVLLGQPDGFKFQTQLDLHPPVFGAIREERARCG